MDDLPFANHLPYFDTCQHIFFMTKIVIFDQGLSQGVSKIGPTHQITLSIHFGGYKEIPTKIRLIESKDRRSS
jgi:hypothetical protein